MGEEHQARTLPVPPGGKRELLERGPLEAVKAALSRFEECERMAVADAALFPERFGIALPRDWQALAAVETTCLQA